MVDAQSGGWRRTVAAIGLVALGALAPTPANAHNVTASITPPATPVVEDSGFPIVFSGDTAPLGEGGGYVHGRIRPVGGPPCAPLYDDDTGERLDFGGALASPVEGPFRAVGSYFPEAPGNYLICGWVLNASGDTGPPSSAMVTVRPPVLQLTAAAPAVATRGAPFAVRVDYQAEVPRYLSVLVVRGSTCTLSADVLESISASPVVVVDNREVAGTGSLTSNVSLHEAGTYLVCGFLDENTSGAAAAQLVVPAAMITVAAPPPAFRSCASAGTRRHIVNVRARNVSCVVARSIARRWGTPRRAPRRVGAYRCFARSGSVLCTAGSAQVRFRYARR